MPDQECKPNQHVYIERYAGVSVWFYFAKDCISDDDNQRQRTVKLGLICIFF